MYGKLYRNIEPLWFVPRMDVVCTYIILLYINLYDSAPSVSVITLLIYANQIERHRPWFRGHDRLLV